MQSDVQPSQEEISFDGYTPLRLGSSVISWTSPPLEHWADKFENKVLMGGVLFELEFEALRLSWIRYRGISEDFDFKIRLLDPGHMTILNLPSGSLDLEESGKDIRYTERSTNTLYAALSNHFRMLDKHIQAELHSKTQVEALQTLLNLRGSGYSPYGVWSGLKWREHLLDSLLRNSKLWFAQPWNEELEIPVTFSQSIADDIYDFLAFATLQAEGNKWKSRGGTHKLNPKNVFFLKAMDEDELSHTQKLFSPRNLKIFLERTKRNPDLDKAIFFLGRDSDPLAEWIAGSVITSTEFQQVLNA